MVKLGKFVGVLALGVAMTGCPPKKTPNGPSGDASGSASLDPDPAPEPGSSGPQPASSNDAPEISRSVGAEGGVVVFWPRVIPRSTDQVTRDLAKAVQDKVVDVVKQALPGKTIDVRPEPERVCPRDGCVGMTVGVLLSVTEGCVAVGLVAGPGKSDTHLTPWGGMVQLKSDTVAFRGLPESEVTIRDHAKCATLVEKMGAKDKAMIEAIQAAAQK